MNLTRIDCRIRSMTTTYYNILSTQSVIILELVRIQLGFSSSDIIVPE